MNARKKLDSEQCRLVDDIVGEALDLPEGERTEHVNRRCDGDREVAEEALSLLRDADSTSRGSIGKPPGLFSPAPVERSDPPEFVGRYRIQSLLATGGQGLVYLAQDTTLDRSVVVKTIPRIEGMSQDSEARLRREASVIGRLDHPCICPVLDFVRAEGRDHVVMPHIKGRSLSDYLVEAVRQADHSLDRPSPWIDLPTPEDDRAEDAGPEEATGIEVQKSPRRTGGLDTILHLVERVADAIHAAHESGVVHRDLKPANIMVRPAGDPVVLDFGLALDETALTRLTHDGSTLGTPLYMSPEQINGERDRIGPGTDIYSLGVILYELLTWQPPYRAQAREALFARILAGRPVRPSQINAAVPREVEAVCLKAMHVDPGSRHPSARALAEELRGLREKITSRTAGAAFGRPGRVGASSVASRSAIRWIAGLACLSGLLLSTAIVLWLHASYLRKAATESGLRADRERGRADREQLGADRERLRADRERCRADMMVVRDALEKKRYVFADRLLWSTPERHRGWEWHYLLHQLYPPAAYAWLEGHEARVYLARFSPDGTRLATASKDNTIRIWDVAECRERLKLAGTRSEVACLGFSDDTARLLIADKSGSSRVIDAATGANLAIIEVDREPRSARFLKDGSKIVLVGAESVRVLDVEKRSGSVLFSTQEKDSEGNEIKGTISAVSRDLGKVAIASGNIVGIYDVPGRKKLGSVKHEYNVHGTVFSPDGKQLLSLSWDDGLVHEIATGNKIRSISGRSSSDVMRLEYESDGKSVSILREQGAEVFDDKQEKAVFDFSPSQGEIGDVFFRRDGESIAAVILGSNVFLWDVQKGDKAAGFRRRVLRAQSGLDVVDISRDGRMAAGGGDGQVVWVWELPSGKPLARLVGHGASLHCVTISSDKKWIVSGSLDETVKIWNVETGVDIATWKAHEKTVIDASFSPDGTRIVTVSRDETAKVWDASSGQELVRLAGHTDDVLHAEFSPDGKRIVTGSEDGTAIVWDSNNGKKLLVLDAHARSSMETYWDDVKWASFSQDARYIATASEDDTARVWDAATGAERAVLRGHGGDVNSARFSPDGKYVITAGGQSVRIWETETGREVGRFEGGGKSIFQANFAEEERRVFAVGDGDAVGEKNILMWDLAEWNRGKGAEGAGETASDTEAQKKRFWDWRRAKRRDVKERRAKRGTR